MRLVVALGGNTLLRRGQPLTPEAQLANVCRAAAQLASVARDHAMVLVHGSGPQVGLLAMQGDGAMPGALPGVTRSAWPLDVLDAEAASMLGYLLEQELANRLPPAHPVATLLTRVQVDAGDPAFDDPAKPIGPLYSRVQAEALAAAQRWTVGRDGAGWRRLVPSPLPRRVLALPSIRALLANGTLVIAGGGGGIPVVPRASPGTFQGIEAVIDKDHCSALLAIELQADCLLIATDVDAVYRDWGSPDACPLGDVSVAEILSLPLAAGSMAPKVAAACNFVRATGRRAVIGSFDAVEAMLGGLDGTQIRAGPGPCVPSPYAATSVRSRPGAMPSAPAHEPRRPRGRATGKQPKP